MPLIAPSAVVDPQAVLADDVEVGAYCVIGPLVKIGRGTKLENHVTLAGRVTLGERNHLFPHAVVGTPPQDRKANGENSRVVIGDGNVIREGVTIHRGSDEGRGQTTIGDGCYLMAHAHVSHDCHLGSRVILANGALVGTHAVIHDDATISAGAAVHHFATVGTQSLVGGLSRVVEDVPPYVAVDGIPAKPRCLNITGLRRQGFAPEVISALHEAYKLLFRTRVGLDETRQTLRDQGQLWPQVTRLLAFLEEQSEGRQGRARDRRRAA